MNRRTDQKAQIKIVLRRWNIKNIQAASAQMLACRFSLLIFDVVLSIPSQQQSSLRKSFRRSRRKKPKTGRFILSPNFDLAEQHRDWLSKSEISQNSSQKPNSAVEFHRSCPNSAIHRCETSHQSSTVSTESSWTQLGAQRHQTIVISAPTMRTTRGDTKKIDNKRIEPTKRSLICRRVIWLPMWS